MEENPVVHDQMKHNWPWPWLQSSKVLWLMPLGLLLLLVQLYWKRERDRHPKPPIPKSEQLFSQAMKTKSLQLLEQAFWNRLWEKGKIPKGNMQLEAFPANANGNANGGLASIRSFIYQLEAWQY